LLSLLCVSTAHADIAQFGACFQESTNAYRCAMNSTYCYPKYGEAWFEPFKLKGLEGRKPCNCGDTHIGNCLPSHGHRGHCALEASVCPVGDDFSDRQWFYNDGASCQCHGMTAHQYSTNVIQTEKTHYGACREGNTIRCAVYSNSCEIGEEWLSPEELENNGQSQCTCDKVRTGSCFSPFGLQCVVDSDSCEADSFLSAFVTMTKGDDCFLCDVKVFDTYEIETPDSPVITADKPIANNDDDDKKANADDDDKKANADDDDKNANDDDDDKKNMQTANTNTNTVSRASFGAVLAFMIIGLTTTVVLTSYLVYLNMKPGGTGTRNVENSVV